MNERDLKVGERRTYLASIARKARKVAELCESEAMGTSAPAQDFLIAQYLHGIILAAIGLCKPQLRAAFIDWVQRRIRDDHAMCSLCGAPKATPDAIACSGCLGDMERIDRELGLDALLDIAHNPDARD